MKSCPYCGHENDDPTQQCLDCLTALPEAGAAPPAVPSAGSVGRLPPLVWGIWPTLGWTLVIAGSVLASQIGVVLILVIARGVPLTGANADELINKLSRSGLTLSLATFASLPLSVGLSVLFATLRKGMRVPEYLGLRGFKIRWAIGWTVVLFGCTIVIGAISSWLGHPDIPDFMIEMYRSAQVLPLLWIALVIGAPVSEEFLFRGFFFTGLRHSRLGGVGAILITAAVWATIHIQYDLHETLMIFVIGLVLGAVRLATDSLWLCIFLHALMNLVATLQVALLKA